jgi:hypothetical protein
VPTLNCVLSSTLPFTLTATAAFLNVLGVVGMKEDLYRLPLFYDPVTPAIRHIERDPRLAIGIYVPITAIHDTVRAPILVVELSIRSHFISILVRT